MPVLFELIINISHPFFTFSPLAVIMFAFSARAEHDQPAHLYSLIMICTVRFSVSMFLVMVSGKMYCRNLKEKSI